MKDPDSTGCTPPDCPDEQVNRLNKGIKRVTLIVSFINTLVRVTQINLTKAVRLFQLLSHFDILFVLLC